MNEAQMIIIDYMNTYPGTLSSSLFIGASSDRILEISKKLKQCLDSGEPCGDSDFIGEWDLI